MHDEIESLPSLPSGSRLVMDEGGLTAFSTTSKEKLEIKTNITESVRVNFIRKQVKMKSNID